jgi:Mn2+/Fe2+ NRAMP family transporter
MKAHRQKRSKTKSPARLQGQLTSRSKSLNPRVAEPPRSWQRLVWLGPGFLWMVSAAGSGELLFTPRVGSLYGYSLLWALVAAVMLKWFINREIGRFTVCTGATVLEGFAQVPGPANWAVWLVLLPQAFVAVTTIAGLAGSAATALILVLPGDVRFWMVGSVLAATALVVMGRYKGVELVATILALALATAAVAAATSIFPEPSALASGFVPDRSVEIDYGEILPWLGFMLSGAAGLMWYSYWLQAKGYGAAARTQKGGKPIDPKQFDTTDRIRLRGWVSQMTLDNSVAVVGTLLITIAFLILGTELLHPEGLLPEENRVAETLGRLLGTIWGPLGFWLMVLGVFVGFWDTVLSDQDGFGRLFANGTQIVAERWRVPRQWLDERLLTRAYVLSLVTALPILLYLIAGEPVGLLKVAGAIEAAHIPVVTGLILYLNHRILPAGLKPSWPVFLATAVSGLFFAAFAAIYVLQLLSGSG